MDVSYFHIHVISGKAGDRIKAWQDFAGAETERVYFQKNKNVMNKGC